MSEKQTPEVEADTSSKPRTAKLRTEGSQLAVPGLLLGIALIWLTLHVMTDGLFLSDRNLVNLMRQTAVTATVALGMLVVIAQAEIDLSVGSLLGTCTVLVAVLESSGVVPFWLTIVAVLSVGVVAGLWNGLWVGVLGVPAFVVTLSGLLIYRGFSLGISGGRTIAGIGPEIRWLGQGYITGTWLWVLVVAALALALIPLVKRLFTRKAVDSITLVRIGASLAVVAAIAWITQSYRGLPVPVFWVLVIALVLGWSLRNTIWGRHVYAVGSSRPASIAAGISVRRHIILSFVLIGVLTAIAAILFVGRLGSSPPTAGLFLELDAIAAVVIGGASLYGGSGKVGGVILGALLTQSIYNGLSLMNVPTAYQYVASGLVLLFAVWVDVALRSARRRNFTEFQL